jgi:hypothetical protein
MLPTPKQVREGAVRALERGTGHPANRLRYREIASRLRWYSRKAALHNINRWLRQERDAYMLASALGPITPYRLQVMMEVKFLLLLSHLYPEYKPNAVILFMLGHGDDRKTTEAA